MLHFEKSSPRGLSSREMVDQVKKHHRHYSKGDTSILEVVEPKTDTAIKHAKEVLRETHCGEDLSQHNPSTHVHLLVEELRKIVEGIDSSMGNKVTHPTFL